MTIGGSVMKAGAGPHGTAKFGFHGNQDIVTLEMVLPNGDIIQTGSAAWPSAGKFERQCLGPDLAGMFIGAEGTLGICTELTIRIRPATDIQERLLAMMPSLDSVIEFGHFINSNTNAPIFGQVDLGVVDDLREFLFNFYTLFYKTVVYSFCAKCCCLYQSFK